MAFPQDRIDTIDTHCFRKKTHTHTILRGYGIAEIAELLKINQNPKKSDISQRRPNTGSGFTSGVRLCLPNIALPRNVPIRVVREISSINSLPPPPLKKCPFFLISTISLDNVAPMRARARCQLKGSFDSWKWFTILERKKL